MARAVDREKVPCKMDAKEEDGALLLLLVDDAVDDDKG